MDPPRCARAALAFGGLGLRWWSQAELGHMFTFEVGIRKDHRLVQTGPYAILRHPSYTGLLVGIIGIALFLRSAANETIASQSHDVGCDSVTVTVASCHAGSDRTYGIGCWASVLAALHWVRCQRQI